MGNGLKQFSKNGYGIFPYLVMCFPDNVFIQMPITLAGYRQHSSFDTPFHGLNIWASSIEKYPTIKKACEVQAELVMVGKSEDYPSIMELCLALNPNYGYYINKSGETKTKNTIPTGGKLYSLGEELILEDDKHYLENGNHFLIDCSEIENIPNNLWQKLSEIDNILERRSVILNDVHSGENRFKEIAEEDPQQLFELLGGNESDIVRYNWAFEYTYEDYIENGELEYNPDEANAWDLEERSIERAHDSGHWYVTGLSILECLNGKNIAFEHQYTEGYYDGIIGTPYDTDEEGNEHGIWFD